MRPIIVLVAILALAACKDQTARTQEEIKAGVNEDRITKKKIQEAYKQSDEKRKAGEAER